MKKTCTSCNRTASVDADFYRNRRTGRVFATCKSCTCARVRLNRLRRLEYYRQFDRLRWDLGGARGNSSKESRARCSRAWVERNREKRKAHVAVSNALRSGKLKRGPCEVCGVDAKVEAHHVDYSKPLDVMWLCCEHHGELRRKHRDPNFKPVRSRVAA